MHSSLQLCVDIQSVKRYALQNLDSGKGIIMQTEVKSAQVNLRLSSALKARAEKAAAQDRRSFTSLIEKLLAEYLQKRSSLQSWHCNAQARFEKLLMDQSQVHILAPRSFRALSFAINTADGYELPPQNLLQIVQSLPNGIRGTFLSSTLFHAYTRHDLAPYYTADASDAAGNEILESAVFPEIVGIAGIIDFWRMAPNGFATHIRSYNEDRTELRKVRGEGRWFWPYQLVRELFELVLHASLLAQHFKSAESVEFRCEWWGLQGREIADAEPSVHWTGGKIAKQDHRITRGEWGIDELPYAPAIVSALAGPVLRLFDPMLECSADWVGQQTARFNRLG
jgi:hypothetical protein